MDTNIEASSFLLAVSHHYRLSPLCKRISVLLMSVINHCFSTVMPSNEKQGKSLKEKGVNNASFTRANLFSV